MTSLTLIGAYGRDYKNQKAVKNDWNAGKDFVIMTMFGGHYGQYVSKREVPKDAVIFIRYNKCKSIVQAQ
jgi:hypothetical protein